MFDRVVVNINVIVFGFTLTGLELTMYCTRDHHANHYTTDAVQCYSLWFYLNGA
jgi:hypothetical protein